MNWQPPQPPSGPPPWQAPPPQPAGMPPYAAAPGMPPVPVYVLSGWWRRVGASILDSLIVGIVSGILAVPVGGWEWTTTTTVNGRSQMFHVNGAGIVIELIVFLFAVPFVMMKTNGRTIGKMATGIRVVREDGQPIGFGFAVLREFVIKNLLFGFAAVFTLGIATLLNYLWPLWDEQNRALHDRIVKSRVVRADAPIGVVGPTWPPAPPMQPPSYPYGSAPPANPYGGAPPVAGPTQPLFPTAPPAAPAPPAGSTEPPPPMQPPGVQPPPSPPASPPPAPPTQPPTPPPYASPTPPPAQPGPPPTQSPQPPAPPAPPPYAPPEPPPPTQAP